MRAILLFLFLVPAGFSGLAQRAFFPETKVGKLLFKETAENEFVFRFADSQDHDQVKENPRLIAALLDVSLGLFGAHRLYLGTDVKVPVFYTLTIGGGGILWLIDLGLILFTKDLAPYMDNPHVFMWVQEE
jgi:TM2 domain-containing membrane protein YozV